MLLFGCKFEITLTFQTLRCTALSHLLLHFHQAVTGSFQSRSLFFWCLPQKPQSVSQCAAPALTASLLAVTLMCSPT